MKGIVQQRAGMIREATPDILEELFEMSNRLCDLCNHPIQDICLASIEHSIPVMKYAKCSDISIEDAVRECNDPSNLRVSHSSCNKAKNDMTRDEWYIRGLHDRKAPRFLTVRELSEFQYRLGSGGRVGGRKNVENRTGLFGRSSEKQSADARKAGIISTYNEVTRNRLAKVATRESCVKGAHAQSREAKVLGGRVGGKISGRIAAERGQIQALGYIQGRKNVEDGQLGRVRMLPQTKKAQQTNGLLMTHIRWHLNRSISRPEICSLCVTKAV
jgi:hypothetical protein